MPSGAGTSTAEVCKTYLVCAKDVDTNFTYYLCTCGKRHVPKADCNCELCSAAVGISQGPKTVTVSRARRMASRVKFKNSECKEPCQEPLDCEGPPCQIKCANIIRRNKRAVKILSKQVKAQKCLMPPCDPRYESVRLFPTAKHATRWQAAYSLARASDTGTSQGTKRKRRKPPEKPSLADFVSNRRDCACELMGRAIRADLHRYMGLRNYRDQINAGVTESPPPEPKPKCDQDD